MKFLDPRPVAAACAVLCCAPLYAQPTPEQTIQEGLRRQEERSRGQQNATQPKADQLTPGAAQVQPRELPQEATCFTVNELALAGKDAGRFGWLLDAAMPYLRRCVGVQGLSFIAAQMDQKLRDLGFATTRVALPAQNLQTGQLLVHMEAGRVTDIRAVRADAAPGTPDVQWGTWRNAFPVSAGDILNVRDLEQGVENMKRLPSQSVATRLEPGDVPGTSVLYIERKGGALNDRLRGGATLDNSGGPSLGRTQLSANVALDNPLGLNDVVTASLNTNAEQPTATHRSQSASVSYSLPWGYNLLTLNASNSRFAQNVQGTTVQFLSSGRSHSAEARLQRTVWRTASTKVGIHGAVATRRAISYLRRPVAGDLTPTGALIAGSNVTLRSTGDLTNSGTIVANGDAANGDGKLSVKGSNVNNSGTLAGNAITIAADNTLNNTGGVVQGLGAGSTASLNARDIILRTTTQSSTASIQGPNGESTGTRTNADRIATVTAESVTIAALNNITLAVASITATGNLTITATGVITSEALQTGYTLLAPLGGSNSGRSGYIGEAVTTQQLTTLSGNNVAITATGDASFKGTNITATNDLAIKGKTVAIDAVKESLSLEQQGIGKKGNEQAASTDEALVGAKVTAGNNLTITSNGTKDGIAIGDITLSSVTLQAGAITSLNANRDIVVQDQTATSTRETEAYTQGRSTLGMVTTKRNTEANSTTTDSVASSITAGGQLSMVAGNDMGIKGVALAGNDGVLLNAGRNLLIVEAHEGTQSSQSDETRKSGFASTLAGAPFPGSKLDSASASSTTDQVVATTITAAKGSVKITAGATATLQGVQITADGNITVKGTEVILTGAVGGASATVSTRSGGAQGDLVGFIRAGHGLNAKGSTDITTIDSDVTRTTLTGQNITIQADAKTGGSGSINLGAVTFNATGTVALQASNTLNLHVQSTRDITTAATSNEDIVWQKVTDAGSIDEQSHITQINAGTLSITAKKVQVEVPVAGGVSVQATLQTLATQPGMGWIAQLQNDPTFKDKVSWQQIEEIHKQWDDKHSGLTGAGAAIVTLVVAYFTAGAGASAAASIGGAINTTVGAAVLQAAITTLTTQASIALINNKGDVGAALREMGSSANVKGLVTALLTAGVLSSINPLLAQPGNQVGGDFINKLQTNLAGGMAKAVISSAINGTSLEDGLKGAIKGAFIDTAAAGAANWIGQNSPQGTQALDTFTAELAHAIAGCAAGAARGTTSASDGCSAGAIGAVAGHLAAQYIDPNGTGASQTIEFASLVAGIAAAATGQDAAGINVAAGAGSNAAANNWLNPDEKRVKQKAEQACNSNPSANAQACGIITALNKLDAAREKSNEGGWYKGITTGLIDLILSPVTVPVEIIASISENGGAATALAILKGIATLPANIVNGLQSDNAEAQGKALVDAVATAAGLSALTKSGLTWYGAKSANPVVNDFFSGARYTDKVINQIRTGDLHAFPESVTAFQGAGQVTKITGGDGVVRDMLKIPGEYRGKQGVFEFIKEPNGSINHRLFKPNLGQ